MKFEPTAESISKHEVPQWYNDATTTDTNATRLQYQDISEHLEAMTRELEGVLLST